MLTGPMRVILNGRGSSTPCTSYFAGSSSDVAIAMHVFAGGQRVLHFLELVDLRQRRRLAEAAIVHGTRLAVAFPAHLLDAVVELVDVAVGVVDVGVPVAARHVAAHALQLGAAFAEELRRPADFLQAARPAR